MSSVEVFALYEWLTWRFGLHGLLAAPAALLLGYVPVLGSLMCYWTATDIWHWESWQAIAAFFWVYLPIVLAVVTVFSFLIWVCGLIVWDKMRKITGL